MLLAPWSTAGTAARREKRIDAGTQVTAPAPGVSVTGKWAERQRVAEGAFMREHR